MGSGIESSLPSFLFTPLFEENCPQLMAMGMSYDEYWNGDPKIATYYIKAHEIQVENNNFMAWLNGVYTAKALDSVVGNMFSKKNSQKHEYFKEPIPITEHMKEQQEEARKKAEFEQMKARLVKWACSTNEIMARKEK